MHRTRPRAHEFTRFASLALISILALSGCMAGTRWKGEIRGDKASRLGRQIARTVQRADNTGGERRFTWVLLIRPEKDPNLRVTEEVARALRGKYEVYKDIESVPPDRLVRTERGIEGFKKGLGFKFSITNLNGGRVKVQYWSYGAGRGSSAYAVTYSWVDADWRPVKKGAVGTS